MGGWGIKNIHFFARALAAKCVWTIVQGEALWCKVVFQKYIDPLSVEDWIRTPRKSFQNASFIWNTVILSFPLPGNWLVWKVGNGSGVILGEDRGPLGMLEPRVLMVHHTSPRISQLGGRPTPRNNRSDDRLDIYISLSSS
jgi:hypothetical protein